MFHYETLPSRDWSLVAALCLVRRVASSLEERRRMFHVKQSLWRGSGNRAAVGRARGGAPAQTIARASELLSIRIVRLAHKTRRRIPRPHAQDLLARVLEQLLGACFT